MDKSYWLLDLAYPWNGTVQHLHPVLLPGDTDTVLVDCGYPGSLELLEAELAARGASLAQVTKLVLTHQDDDHMGAAAELKERYPALQILASETEALYISGERKTSASGRRRRCRSSCRRTRRNLASSSAGGSAVCRRWP